MRGIINFFQGVSFQVREFGLSNTIANGLMEARAAFDDYIGVYQHPDGMRMGAVVYIRLPFTRLSAIVEWSAVSLGWGVERTEGGLDIYTKRLKTSLCREQGEMYRSARNFL
jgi:hypothetical protein